MQLDLIIIYFYPILDQSTFTLQQSHLHSSFFQQEELVELNHNIERKLKLCQDFQKSPDQELDSDLFLAQQSNVE